MVMSEGRPLRSIDYDSGVHSGARDHTVPSTSLHSVRDLSLPSHGFFPLLSVTIGRVFVTQVQQEVKEITVKINLMGWALDGRLKSVADELPWPQHLAISMDVAGATSAHEGGGRNAFSHRALLHVFLPQSS